jgi:hypothetical protein
MLQPSYPQEVDPVRWLRDKAERAVSVDLRPERNQAAVLSVLEQHDLLVAELRKHDLAAAHRIKRHRTAA